MDDVEVPNNYALSAGTSTIFLNSSVAYDTEADWVSGKYSTRFNNGDRLYDDVRTSSNGTGGGLGPVYAGYSCGSCHRNAGRTNSICISLYIDNVPNKNNVIFICSVAGNGRQP